MKSEHELEATHATPRDHSDPVGAQHAAPGANAWHAPRDPFRAPVAAGFPLSRRGTACRARHKILVPVLHLHRTLTRSEIDAQPHPTNTISNRQSKLIEIVVSPTKQTIGTHSNRQLFGGVAKPWLTGFLAVFFSILSLAGTHPAAAQGTSSSKVPGELSSDLKDFVETPSVSGYEHELSEKIRGKLAAFHPVADNLGDVIVTIGSGSPHRLIVTPIDEPGFVVSDITPDGYLRLQRLPQAGGLPPIYNSLLSAQPVKVRTTSGKWIDGVVAGISVHLHRATEIIPSSSEIENMYVDIGAASAAEARAAGVDNLSPVAINRELNYLLDKEIAGASIGDKFGAVVLIDVLRHADPAAIQGTLTVAFVTQQRFGRQGLDRIVRSTSADEMIYVGRLLPGGNVPGMQGVHRAPRREPESGVLVGFQSTGDELTGFAAELKKLADPNKIRLETDYSASIAPTGYLAPPAFPAKWAHVGIATVWPDTPAESLSWSDSMALRDLIFLYVEGKPFTPDPRQFIEVIGGFAGKETPKPANFQLRQVLSSLVEVYGASNHEGRVREDVERLLPAWAKPETDEAGNLILHVGTAATGTKTPKILVVAHMDEIGFSVKSIAQDGRLVVETLGGMDLSFYQGHPVIVQTSAGERSGVIELPNGWDEQNFKWAAASAEQAVRIDVGVRSAKEAAEHHIEIGDSVTIPKKYRPLLGTRANGRAFDDRVGDTALISAVWALGAPLKDRDVTFVWSTGEELGLIGAGKLATRLAAEGHTPDYVFAIDTFVSSDSPLESKRFGDAQIGKGFAVRAVDQSNITPFDLVQKVIKLAHANQIPVQFGVTAGGNDGSTYVPFGAVDIPLGWPLRYSHSPAEVVDTRDVDALGKIVAAIARSW
jgi:putative aminopeptidase FrvX